MRRFLTVSAGVFVLTLTAIPAAAQPGVPVDGGVAFGVDAGFNVGQAEFHVGPLVAGYGEYYLTRRTSLRASLAWTNPALDRGAGDTLHQIHLLFNVLYNWESGLWHPFVTAGLGALVAQPRTYGAATLVSQTKGALTFGGGIEYFSRRKTTIKTEMQYHVAGHDLRRPDPSGLTLTVGLKRYI